jgi:hypothetical protein
VCASIRAISARKIRTRSDLPSAGIGPAPLAMFHICSYKFLFPARESRGKARG